MLDNTEPRAYMESFRTARVSIETSGLYCAAGSTVAELLEFWVKGKRLPTKLPFPGDWLPHTVAYQVDKPNVRNHIYDRKALRTMEGQALNAMAAAMTCVKSLNGFTDPTRVGLYMGMPTVEEPVPSWEVLNELSFSSTAVDLSTVQETIISNTPPMTGLLLLNSTACSHIASQFAITGTFGVFSPWADAGLEAIIEAAWSIAEGDNDRALVGAVAPTVNPFLYLNYECQGLLRLGSALPVSGEGAAFIALQATNAKPAVCLAGYARSFAPDVQTAQAARRYCMEEALVGANISADEVGWILFDPLCGRAGIMAERAAIAELFGDAAPLGSWHEVCGYLGPAQPVLNAAVAATALMEGWRVVEDPTERTLKRQNLPLRHVLINASGCRGQFVSLVMSLYE